MIPSSRTIARACLLFLFIAGAHSCSYAADHRTHPIPSLQTIVFQNVHVIPMTGETVLHNHDVIVRGDRIASVVPTGTGTIPADAHIIPSDDRWLSPGLADMHIHITSQWMSTDWPINPLNLYLAHGVTTIRCFGPDLDDSNSTAYVLAWRTQIDDGILVGPRIYSCGPILYGPLNNPAQAVRTQKRDGYDFIKVYSYLAAEEFSQVADAADDSGIYVAGHIPMPVGLDGTLNGELDEIAHIEELAWEYAQIDRTRKDINGREWFMYAGKALYTAFVNKFDLTPDEILSTYHDSLQDIARRVKEAGITVSTTLFLDEIIIDKVLHPEEFLKRSDITLMPSWYLTRLSQKKDKHQLMFAGTQNFASLKRNLDIAILRALKTENVPLVLGTDSGGGGMGLVPGASLHEELRVLVDSGFTPYEALALGTVGASQVVSHMTGEDDFGVIAAGRRADLLLLSANPLKDIDNIKNIEGVMASGRWYDKHVINEWKHP